MIWPLSGRMRPLITRMSVVLPTPLPPVIQAAEPAAAAKDRSASTGSGRRFQDLVTPVTVRTEDVTAPGVITSASLELIPRSR